MLMWLYNNISTIIISTMLLAVIAAVIISMVRNKQKGKSSCGCGCENCALSGSCHSKR